MVIRWTGRPALPKRIERTRNSVGERLRTRTSMLSSDMSASSPPTEPAASAAEAAASADPARWTETAKPREASSARSASAASPRASTTRNSRAGAPEPFWASFFMTAFDSTMPPRKTPEQICCVFVAFRRGPFCLGYSTHERPFRDFRGGSVDPRKPTATHHEIPSPPAPSARDSGRCRLSLYADAGLEERGEWKEESGKRRVERD